MRWYHEPNTLWLIARHGYLTASDFKDLGPLYDAWQEAEEKARTNSKVKPESKKEVLIQKMENIFWEKQAAVVDTYETEAMRRGHCLEGEAVKVYCDNTGKTMYHWDDALIYEPMFYSGASPDALDVPQPNDGKVEYKVDDIFAEHGLEIKCYNPTNHMRNYRAKDKMSIDRDILYQAAWELATMKLQDITVVFYHPGMSAYRMKTYTYNREDLKELCKTANAVLQMYNDLTIELVANTPTTEFHSTETELTLMEKYEF